SGTRKYKFSPAMRGQSCVSAVRDWKVAGGVMKVSVRIALFVFLAAVFSAGQAFSQQITGAVTGTVTDASGAAVSGAQARLTNTGTGTVASVTSDSAGNIEFLLLSPGTYSLQVTSPGFKSFVREG